MKARVIDETGDRYGRLLVVKRVPSDGRGAMWLCQCSCGNETVVYGISLRSGRTTSCKCKSGEWNRLPKGQAAFNGLFNSYKNSAKRRKIAWELSKEQFRELTRQNCYYCEDEPSGVFSGERYNGHYKYNGIDRINNDKDYTINNVVSCCKVCNYAKGQMSLVEFITWIKAVYEKVRDLQ